MNEIRNIKVNTPFHFFLKHLQGIDPSFVTISKPLSNKIGETFCERVNVLKKMDKKVYKHLSFSQNLLNIL